MKKLYVVLALSLLLIGTVAVGTITVNEYYKKVAPKSCKESYLRGEFIWLPENLANLTQRKIVNLHFSMINGNNITINGIVKGNAIRDFHCGGASGYDFEFWMSDMNALELATSKKPITIAVRLWRSGQMTIHANGEENERILALADQLVAQDDEPVPEWIRENFGRFIG